MQAQIQFLLALQNVDLALEKINKKKGDLPKQIAALSQTLKNLEAKKDAMKAEVAQQDAKIEAYQEEKKNVEKLIKKYQTDQLSTTDNNSDYDTLSRNIALQELEAQIIQKNIKATNQIIKEKKERLTKIRAEIRACKESLKLHKEELKNIQKEVVSEEEKLIAARPHTIEKIEASLYEEYENKRKHLIPSYVITKVEEEACGGCFHRIPPQQQTAIIEGKKIIQCEYCTRILAEVIEPELPVKKKSKAK